MILRFLLSLLLVSSMVGCATTRRPSQEGKLKIRIAQLESQLGEQDQSLMDMQSNVDDLTDQIRRMSVPAKFARVNTSQISRQITSLNTATTEARYQEILRVPVPAKDVQVALKSAGYYKGSIDGKLGSGSQKAIKEFQTDHDVVSDGIVGNKTWTELKSYLEQ